MSTLSAPLMPSSGTTVCTVAVMEPSRSSLASVELPRPGARRWRAPGAAMKNGACDRRRRRCGTRSAPASLDNRHWITRTSSPQLAQRRVSIAACGGGTNRRRRRRRAAEATAGVATEAAAKAAARAEEGGRRR